MVKLFVLNPMTTHPLLMGLNASAVMVAASSLYYAFVTGRTSAWLPDRSNPQRGLSFMCGSVGPLILPEIRVLLRACLSPRARGRYARDSQQSAVFGLTSATGSVIKQS
jgi:hypothetical protein